MKIYPSLLLSKSEFNSWMILRKRLILKMTTVAVNLFIWQKYSTKYELVAKEIVKWFHFGHNEEHALSLKNHKSSFEWGVKKLPIFYGSPNGWVPDNFLCTVVVRRFEKWMKGKNGFLVSIASAYFNATKTSHAF